jgi:probable F420-dependent oxidoreductase
MKFGFGNLTLQKPPWDDRSFTQLYEDILTLAELADTSGFDSFWLAEHHGAADGYNPALLPFLSAVAARTRRLELGTAVMLAPFHDPLRIAEDAAAVDNISGGRLNLGLGLGWAPEEYRMFGVDGKGRGQRLAEFTQVLKAAWTQERFSFDGRFYNYDDISITPKPARTIPVWLGGNADAALERAARWGDGHFPPSTVGLPALKERADVIKQMRNDAGLDTAYGFGTFVPVGIGADADEAWASIRDGVLHVRGSYALWAQNKRDVTDAVATAAPFEEQVRAGCVLGTPKQIVETLKPVADELGQMGFEPTFFSAQLMLPGMPLEKARVATERFATEVVPYLR